MNLGKPTQHLSTHNDNVGPSKGITDLVQISILVYLAVLLGGVVQLLEDIDWGRGLEKALLIATASLGCIALYLLWLCHSGVMKRYSRVAFGACLTSAIIVSAVVFYFTLAEASRSTRFQAAGLALCICALLAADRLSGGKPLPASVIRRAADFGLAFAVLYQLVQFLRYLNTPDLIDIGRTTLESVQGLLVGLNPYAEPIDVHPDFPQSGYKYLPMMAVTYLPLGAAFGATGIRLTNLILMYVVGAEIYLLVRRMAPEISARLAALLFLLMPTLPRMLYAQGVTDLAPVAFLLAGFIFYRDRPWLSGFMMGLSVSAKLTPGMFSGVCAMPKSGRSQYIVGGVVGLIPSVVFFLWSPVAFYQNIFVFLGTRPVDSTSWMQDMPSSVAFGARALFGAMLLSVTLGLLLKPPHLLSRCLLFSLLALAATLTGPAAHNNYIIWWLPTVCVVFAIVLMPHFPVVGQTSVGVTASIK